MMDDKSNFFSELEFTGYYRLNSVPETMALIEAECFHTLADTNNSHADAKGIIFALGFISTIIVLSGVQLHRSLKVTPINSKITKPQTLSTFDTKKISTLRSERKLKRVQSLQTLDWSTDKIEILTIKNAVALGRF
ncbi:hypothetical protein H1P_3660005 [Hyella patelloides LEGE 07179]|uniref:Uncharacterized protein n=1 Tax=Hyella patelloides LEGE 07179 TaxID=945734 RepID=A0A563VWF0_9CYAN|nr:hypothetical protein [Hyella patelloides]VEP15746.1 hypothetical protein H1P_3660005 [Hyella patelloides LEGE 07179]